MVDVYPARYRDGSGEQVTAIRNDGRTLRMTVRGVEFSGEDFDAFAPSPREASASLASFTFQRGCLCSCTIDCEMPIPVVIGDRNDAGLLLVHLELGAPGSKGGLERESLQLELQLQGARFLASGRSGWFEDELLEIQSQLPEGTHLKACITCALSDYSPAGHGLFGCLACFRRNKDAYRAVKSKQDLFRIWDSRTEFVQETYICPEFENRLPGTGYRG
jgi:hypothetical protein